MLEENRENQSISLHQDHSYYFQLILVGRSVSKILMDSFNNSRNVGDIFSNEMQAIWQENVSKRIIRLEEKIETISRNQPVKVNFPNVSYPNYAINPNQQVDEIETKVLPFMDYLSHEMEGLKECHLSEQAQLQKKMDDISLELCNKIHKQQMQKQLNLINESVSRELQSIYEVRSKQSYLFSKLVRQNIVSQKDILEEFQQTKLTFKDQVEEIRRNVVHNSKSSTQRKTKNDEASEFEEMNQRHLNIKLNKLLQECQQQSKNVTSLKQSHSIFAYSLLDHERFCKYSQIDSPPEKGKRARDFQSQEKQRNTFNERQAGLKEQPLRRIDKENISPKRVKCHSPRQSVDQSFCESSYICKPSKYESSYNKCQDLRLKSHRGSDISLRRNSQYY